MHSRIFQVSINPIEKADYIDESHYCDHWFTNQIADYVSDNCNRNDDIEWLKNCINGCGFGADNYGEYLVVNSREEYFNNAFEDFKEIVDRLSVVTLQEFTNKYKVSYDVWAIKNTYEDKNGFYIDADGELMPFDKFIRWCAIGEKYYFGATIDYHY